MTERRRILLIFAVLALATAGFLIGTAITRGDYVAGVGKMIGPADGDRLVEEDARQAEHE